MPPSSTGPYKPIEDWFAFPVWGVPGWGDWDQPDCPCDCPPPPCDCDWLSDCETDDYPPYPQYPENALVPTDIIARDERRRKRKRGASGAHEPASDSCRASRPVRRARRTRRPAVAVGCSGVPARRHPQILPRAIRRTAHTAAAAVRHVLGERAAELAVALAPGTVALRAVDAQHGQCPRGAGACLGVPSQIARTARLPDHHASIARNGCEPARIPVFCPCCRAEHQRRRVWSGQERGPRRRRRRRRRRRPVGGPVCLVGGVGVHWPAPINSHCTDCRTSPCHLVRPGRWEGVVCPFRAARQTGWHRGRDD